MPVRVNSSLLKPRNQAIFTWLFHSKSSTDMTAVGWWFDYMILQSFPTIMILWNLIFKCPENPRNPIKKRKIKPNIHSNFRNLSSLPIVTCKLLDMQAILIKSIFPKLPCSSDLQRVLWFCLILQFHMWDILRYILPFFLLLICYCLSRLS